MRKNVFLKLILFFVFVALATISSLSYAEDQSPSRETSVISGSVSSADWVARKITVDSLDDELTIFVPQNIPLVRGTEEIGEMDIEEGDDVEVVYYNDPVNGPTAVKVADLNLLNE